MAVQLGTSRPCSVPNKQNTRLTGTKSAFSHVFFVRAKWRDKNGRRVTHVHTLTRNTHLMDDRVNRLLLDLKWAKFSSCLAMFETYRKIEPSLLDYFIDATVRSYFILILLVSD